MTYEEAVEAVAVAERFDWVVTRIEVRDDRYFMEFEQR